MTSDFDRDLLFLAGGLFLTGVGAGFIARTVLTLLGVWK